MNKLSIQESYFSCQTKGDKCNSPDCESKIKKLAWCDQKRDRL